MDTPPSAQRETLDLLVGEAANLATELADQIHRLSDVDHSDPDGAMLVNINTTKALWAKDILVSLLTKVRDDDS
jgi:hypothetical protein